MRKILSAIIIDNNADKHDYSLVKTSFPEYMENNFDICVLNNTSNILSDINKFKDFDCLITVGNNLDLSPLNNLSFEFRKKWVHIEDFDGELISSSILSTFLYNINRDRKSDKLFSIFTCTFNTDKYMIDRLYRSLCSQTYKNWNWWILDDSTNNMAIENISKLADPRIIIIKNITNHGNIGFNKHIIASACDGDYLVEVDHDDELTANCLELLKKAFDTYPLADFVYSHAFEELDGEPVYYEEGLFALGQAKYNNHEINGKYYNIAETPDINALTIRHIVSMPNHVRCWKKDFYHKIGGHNTELSVLDDMDIIIRTFLYGKMCKIPKVLYIQHEGTSKDGNGRGSTTQGARLNEIKRTGVLLRNKYDKQIHNRVKELGFEDIIWHGDDDNGESQIKITTEKIPNINYVL